MNDNVNGTPTNAKRPEATLPEEGPMSSTIVSGTLPQEERWSLEELDRLASLFSADQELSQKVAEKRAGDIVSVALSCEAIKPIKKALIILLGLRTDVSVEEVEANLKNLLPSIAKDTDLISSLRSLLNEKERDLLMEFELHDVVSGLQQSSFFQNLQNPTFRGPAQEDQDPLNQAILAKLNRLGILPALPGTDHCESSEGAKTRFGEPHRDAKIANGLGIKTDPPSSKQPTVTQSTPPRLPPSMQSPQSGLKSENDVRESASSSQSRCIQLGGVTVAAIGHGIDAEVVSSSRIAKIIDEDRNRGLQPDLRNSI